MSRQTIRDLIIISGVLLGLGFFLSKIPWNSILPKFSEFTISIEDEEKLGDLMAKNIIDQDSLTSSFNNKMADSVLQIIATRLVSNLPNSKYHFRIKVIPGEEVNAFTIPGGNIFVYKGLIEFSENPEEVAAVLAHELGHAENRHVIFKMVKEVGISLVAGLITGGNPGLLGEIGRKLASTKFDREQETEADLFSFELLEKSGINPIHSAHFFQKLNGLGNSTDSYTEMFMTHPNNDSRVEAAKNYALKFNFKEQNFDLNWGEVKASLKADSSL